jgi:hypothetical protein
LYWHLWLTRLWHRNWYIHIRGGHKEQVDRNVHESEDDKSCHDNESNKESSKYRGRGRGDQRQHDRKYQRDQDDETEIADVNAFTERLSADLKLCDKEQSLCLQLPRTKRRQT